MYRRFLQIGALLGALGVALGAFGAHSLKALVSAESLNAFETGCEISILPLFCTVDCSHPLQEVSQQEVGMGGNIFHFGDYPVQWIAVRTHHPGCHGCFWIGRIWGHNPVGWALFYFGLDIPDDWCQAIWP